MNAQILSIFVLCAAFSAAVATPLQQNAYRPNYGNIPRCLQPKESGLCLAYFPSYYYSAAHNTCLEFIYGGCQGNQNRFVTFDDCMASCEGTKIEEQEFKLVLPEKIDICSLQRETGPCRAGIPRFYFNGDKCEEFLFGGCEGNENNFKSLEDCQSRCSNESSEDQPSTENKSEEVAGEQPESEEVEKNE